MHRVAVSLHTLSLICNTMQHHGHCLTYLCILVRCRECPHTERSRSSQRVPVVPSPLRYPGDQEDPERHWSQMDLGVPFATLLVALWTGERRGELERPGHSPLNEKPTLRVGLFASRTWRASGPQRCDSIFLDSSSINKLAQEKEKEKCRGCELPPTPSTQLT